jgi:hypothetical protein
MSAPNFDPAISSSEHRLAASLETSKSRFISRNRENFDFVSDAAQVSFCPSQHALRLPNLE